MATKKSTSTAVATKANTSMVSIQEALKAQAAVLGDRLMLPGGNKIKLAPGKMTLPDGTVTAGPLEAVIVDFTARNMFYEGAYSKDNVSPPACFAIGTDPKNMVPSPNSPLPQAAECNDCPMNAFNSRGAGKACKNERLLALLPPESTPEAPLEKAPMWTLSVSPTKARGFDGYVGDVRRTFALPPIGVVTSISLDSKQDYPALDFGDPLPNPNLAVHFARQGEAQAMLAVEPDVSQFVAQSTKAPAKKAAPVRAVPRR